MSNRERLAEVLAENLHLADGVGPSSRYRETVARALADALLASDGLAGMLAEARAEAWDEALGAVVRGVRSAMDAHREHGHRQIVAALSGLTTAVPRTENPYRAALTAEDAP